MIRNFSALIIAGLICSPLTSANADGPALIQIEVDRVKYEGRVEVRTDSQCWLMSRAGGLTELELAKVSNVKQLSPRFQPLTSTMLNTELKREFGHSLEIGSSRHYLVAAPAGKAKAYAELFEDIYRSFHMHFSVRGFNVEDPEFPLVAIVFPDHATFAAYSKQDDVEAKPGLMGYYMQSTNRVALFEGKSPRDSTGKDATTKSPASSKNVTPRPSDFSVEHHGSLKHHGDWSGAIEGNLRDTMIHEATHQVAFNVGLHARIGSNPTWIVEGLATVFEADGMRDGTNGRSAIYRVNRDRLVWFQAYAKERHKPGSLEKFVRNDALFKTQTLDAYAFSWALSFFLIETRPRQYATLLKQLGSREPLTELTEEERLASFQTTIGSNLKLIEAEMLRYFDRIK